MMRLCITMGTLIGSYAGWGIAQKLGCSFMVDFLVSGVGSIVGVYAGWKIARRFG